MTGEFDIIARYLRPLSPPQGLNLQDDAAVFSLPAGDDIVITKDVLIEGVHFMAGTDPALVAKKVLRVNLSDIAAMGAAPVYYLIGAALPHSVNDAWLAAFSEALKDENKTFGVALLGGDTTSHKGALMLSVTMIGRAEKGKLLKRCGAAAGDGIYVSGTIGDAALGLLAAKGEVKNLAAEDRHALIQRYHIPLPRLLLGQALVGVASAAMDVSDGLLGDLSHICRASSVGALVNQDTVPLSAAVRKLVANTPAYMNEVMTGGDDYELIFTVPETRTGLLPDIARKADVPIVRIGCVTSEKNVITVTDGAGREVPYKKKGYTHFA